MARIEQEHHAGHCCKLEPHTWRPATGLLVNAEGKEFALVHKDLLRGMDLGAGCSGRCQRGCCRGWPGEEVSQPPACGD
eukprot:11201176-Lingulodinium_polyedra.AAC.1